MNQGVDEKIFNIFKFTNSPTEDDMVIEKCGDSYPERLGEYFIVLPKNQIPAFKILLDESYRNYNSYIARIIETHDTERLAQAARVYFPDAYTNLFIKHYGGIDSLINNGPSGIVVMPTEETPKSNSLFDDSDFVDDDFVPEDSATDSEESNSEEDDEVINKELQVENEQLKKMLNDYKAKAEKYTALVGENASEVSDETMEQVSELLINYDPAILKDALIGLVLKAYDSDKVYTDKLLEDFTDVLMSLNSEEEGA